VSRLSTEWQHIEWQLRDLLPRTPVIELSVTPDVRRLPRHFADVTMGTDPIELRVHPELLDARVSRIRGILTHECGHIADGVLGDGAFRRVCRRLDVPYTEDEERRADILGEWVTGWHVWYDDEDIQCAGRGAHGQWERPTGLR
jgi:hypothetical protein